MSTVKLLKDLKSAIHKLSADLDKAAEREKSMEKALRMSFPYELYRLVIRPDVAEKIGASEEELLAHFIEHGSKDGTRLKYAMKELLIKRINKNEAKKKEIKVKNLLTNYHENDFISQKYDSTPQESIKKVCLILSTPRSGSTYLCSKIYQKSGIIGHEYFQPHGYMQHLARRWGCIDDNGNILKSSYWNSLIKYRSYKNVLIINLHGSHLPTFKLFSHFLGESEIKCIHLIREDVMKQAVSYYVASKTGMWTSECSSTGEINISKTNISEIQKYAERINHQNLKINQFVYHNNLEAKSILHADILSEKGLRSVINFFELGGIEPLQTFPIAASKIKKQKSAEKDQLIKFFSLED